MFLEISRAADTLVSQSTIFNCSYEVAWKDYMHPAITDQVNFDDVISYINKKVKLGQEHSS